MAEALTTQEQLAVEEFLGEVRSREQPHSAGLVSQPTAVKFLMARKFDVSRAIDLFQAYKNTRIKEGIININPDEEPLRSELLSGKFTVLPGRDAKGAALALFTARLHRPDVTTHKAVLQAIIYQLDKAIESVQTQRDGLIFIYDMTNSSYGNFDYELCVKILNLLKVCTVKAHELASHIPVSSLPEHLGGTSQYSHVAWIQSCVNSHTNTVQGDTQEHDTQDCVGNLLRSYSLECSNTSAGATLSRTHINTQLGSELAVANSNCYDDSNANPHNHCGVADGRTQGQGLYQQRPQSAANRPQGNHQHWNGSAMSVANMAVSGSSPNANMNGRGRQAPPQSDTPPDTLFSQKVDGDAAEVEATDSAHSSQNDDVKEEEGEDEEGVPPLPQKSLPRPPHHPTSQSPPLSSSWVLDDEDSCMEASIHMPEHGGMTVHDLVEHVKRKKKKGIYQEYEEIRKEPPAGAFDYSKKLSNQIKNRYSDVLCLDQSRVRLCQLCDDEDETSDYINASFMDGYKRSNAYIATQGPLPKTFGDFWRMVWEQMVLIIVMTTRVVERGRVKCGQYWPLEEGRTEQHGYFLVRNTHIQVFQDFKLSHLELYNTQSGERREVCHYLYVSWPDFGVPKSASAMLDFREHVLQRREAAVQSLGSSWTGPPGGPPVVVHCSAGIGRTGTFCTLDICLSRLEDIATVDIRQTVRRMRTQRAFSIQTWDQYYFCYTAVIEYAQRHGKLSPVQWSDSDLETDSE
ncbi:tyrosine-protein phosphatase non-receptor type 9 isoform X2 [Etheostoma spectabile]|uniref:tyrosine-protein phosphatase non-receptor type 9 isoform X2 n=1 Tax=Etheostoma spectabile TaxID=54343 RepID=UPI0013AF2F97|nr:tyrosine-protein phosphatase non-receptor type 9-like isoform X2 [Etheostoma spectabile]